LSKTLNAVIKVKEIIVGILQLSTS
jgi:hypothetical protein